MQPHSPEWMDAPRLPGKGNREIRRLLWLSALGVASASAAAGLALESATPRPRAAPPAPRPVPAPAIPPSPEGALEPASPIPEVVPTAAAVPQGTAGRAPAGKRQALLRIGAHPRLTRTSLPLPSVGSGVAARWIRAGNTLAARGRFLAALKAFQRAAGVDVHSADAWYGIALCDYELYRDAASEQATTQALFADPAHAMGNLLAGFLHQQRGDVAGARQLYGRYLSREPNGRYSEDVVSVLEQLPPFEE